MGLRDYLQMMDDMVGNANAAASTSFAYRSLYAFYLQHGTMLQSETLPKEWKRVIWRDVSAARPVVKQCFYNAQKLVLANPNKYVYVEGFTQSPRVPLAIQHGWVVTKDRKHLIDPTLKLDFDKRYSSGNIVMGRLPEGWEYFGVAFSAEAIKQHWVATGNAGSLVDYPFTILKDGLKEGVLAA